MSGSLDHSPAEIIRKLLIDLSLGVGATAGTWPVFDTVMVGTPDSQILVTETTNKVMGRLHPTGETQEHYGIQIRVRGADFRVGEDKIRDIAVSLDTDVLRDAVTIGSSVYVVQAVNRVSGPMHTGKETPTSKRNLFSLNVTAAIRQTS